MLEPRCLDCGYILTGLDSGRCPECGRTFIPGNATTFTYLPIYDRWRFWLPGFLLTLAFALVGFPLLIYFAGFGWTVTIVLPACLGILIGYSCRVSMFFKIVLGVVVLVVTVLGLRMQSFVGVYCAMVLLAMAIGPLMVGMLVGVALRTSLKSSKWDQRFHLPTLLILMTPLILGTIEANYQQPYADETVTTSVVLPVSSDRAWDTLMFYEEVRGTPPLLMRFALPRPLYTVGSVESVGDMKVCIYSKGRLIKRVTNRVPDEILGFDVVAQEHIENRSVVLKGGSFRFDAVSDDQTRVTLSTTYQPLLGPRFAWRWAEEIGIHTLHGYVLNGMRLKAMAEGVPVVVKPAVGGAS